MGKTDDPAVNDGVFPFQVTQPPSFFPDAHTPILSGHTMTIAGRASDIVVLRPEGPAALAPPCPPADRRRGQRLRQERAQAHPGQPGRAVGPDKGSSTRNG